MTAAHVHRGILLRDAIPLAQSLGFSVRWFNATGELEFAHPTIARRLRINSRRKDVPRTVVVALRRIAGARA